MIEVSASMYLATATSVSASQDGRICPPRHPGWSAFSMLETFHRPVPAGVQHGERFARASGGIEKSKI